MVGLVQTERDPPAPIRVGKGYGRLFTEGLKMLAT